MLYLVRADNYDRIVCETCLRDYREDSRLGPADEAWTYICEDCGGDGEAEGPGSETT